MTFFDWQCLVINNIIPRLACTHNQKVTAKLTSSQQKKYSIFFLLILFTIRSSVANILTTALKKNARLLCCNLSVLFSHLIHFTSHQNIRKISRFKHLRCLELLYILFFLKVVQQKNDKLVFFKDILNALRTSCLIVLTSMYLWNNVCWHIWVRRWPIQNILK